MANWSFEDPGDAIADGSVIDSGNFTQLNPDTPIMVGKPLTINGGNWTNVRQDAAWTVNGGNWGSHNWCSHLHPDLVDKGLSACELECVHLVDIDIITIDGIEVDRIYQYEDM